MGDFKQYKSGDYSIGSFMLGCENGCCQSYVCCRVQQRPVSASQVSGATPVLQKSSSGATSAVANGSNGRHINCHDWQWSINKDACDACGITGSELAAMGYGYDPNDIQPCCDNSSPPWLLVNGVRHNFNCPVAEREHNRFYKCSITPQSQPLSCNHEFKNYTGLNESFEYCVKCDVKRS